MLGQESEVGNQSCNQSCLIVKVGRDDFEEHDLGLLDRVLVNLCRKEIPHASIDGHVPLLCSFPNMK